MCDDHDDCPQQEDDGIARRTLFKWAGAVGAGLVLGEHATPAARAATVTAPVTPAAAAAAVSYDGLSAKSMAMHVHSVFSEGSGSMEAQLYEATKNTVDVLWWTDHEYKMRAYKFKSHIHFTSLTNETTDGPVWNWVEQRTGSLTSRSTGGIDSQNSPNDPITSGSLRVAAESTSTALAKQGYLASTGPTKQQRTNVYGQVWTVDVLPLSIGSGAYLEMLIALSTHPAQDGRPQGQYQVSYRLGGSGPLGRQVIGNSAVVTLAAVTGQWNTINAAISDDIAALWPNMNPRDFTTLDVQFNAASTGGFAQGNFDYVRINRPYTTGDVPLQIQQSIGSGYASKFPAVAQRQGLEVSYGPAHVNWFGGTVSIPPVWQKAQETWDQYLVDTVVQVHNSGGLASLNHPYGAGAATVPLQSQSTQDTALSQMATKLLRNNVYGADIIEVGYPKRNGYDLTHHVGLWDVLSRNARFLTGNGVTDDHNGTGWFNLTNNWVTLVWAPGNSEADLLAALTAGRAWTTSIKNKVTLDLLVDGKAPMGSASVSQVTARQLRIYAGGLPVGSRVEVVRGVVDYAGTANVVPNSTVVATYAPADFGSAGSVDSSVDTSRSCFVRVNVKDSSGAVVATSNPVWLLREVPSSGIPAARLR